jgi:hypothetical protein
MQLLLTTDIACVVLSIHLIQLTCSFNMDLDVCTDCIVQCSSSLLHAHEAYTMQLYKANRIAHFFISNRSLGIMIIHCPSSTCLISFLDPTDNPL